jgi:Protein of unknown function (DUF2786)
MTSEQVIDKVRKLLAIAESTPYEAEAQTAMALVQKLLLKHELSMTDVSDSDADRKFEAATVLVAPRAPTETKFVAAIVRDFFFCFPVIDTTGDDGCSRVILFGRRENVAVGTYVYTFLTRIFRALWPPYRVAHALPQRDRQAFWLGMQLGLAGRLFEERRKIQDAAGGPAAKNQLMRLQADIEAAAEIHFGGLTARSGRHVTGSPQTFDAGIERGRRIDIRQPLPAPCRQLSIAEER